jgi:hypothetical protein
LPAKSPELNPQENVWHLMRENWLSDRIFGAYDQVVDRDCDAWNKLIAHPETITSFGTRDWAHLGQAL